MSKFVPYEKASKKRQRAYDSSVRILTSKNICDVPHKSVKDYNRSRYNDYHDDLDEYYNEEEIE